MGGTVSGVLSTLAQIAETLAGAAPVTLGSFAFQDTEVPQNIPYGGQQRLAVQRLIGGARVIEAMGYDPRDIVWSGIIRTADQSDRATQLQQMMAAGTAVPLSWGSEYLSVVIRDFQPKQEAFWISYSITCCVLLDQSMPGTGAPPNLLSQVTDDAASALGFSPSDLPAVETAIGSAQTAVAAASALAPGSAAFSTALASLGAAQVAVGGAVSAANGSLGGVIKAASIGTGILGATGVSDGIAKLGAATTAAGDLAGLLASSGYVNRIVQNMTAEVN